MNEIRDLKAKYITDDKGKATAVVLPIDEFEELLEDLQDLAILAERRTESTLSLEEVIDHLKQNGFLPD